MHSDLFTNASNQNFEEYLATANVQPPPGDAGSKNDGADAAGDAPDDAAGDAAGDAPDDAQDSGD